MKFQTTGAYGYKGYPLKSYYLKHWMRLMGSYW